MKIDAFLEDLLTIENFQAVQKIAAIDTEVFSDIVKIADLDPGNDFKFSDLCGVDFCNSDLRGYDFTGADLRGAFGRDVLWDDTTILTGAEVSGSLFAYETSKREFLSDLTWRNEYDRRNRDYWTKNIEWFSDRFVKGHRDRIAAIELAKAVCDGTSDGFLRSQLLFFLAPAFSQASEHRDFLIHNLAKHAGDSKTVRVTLQALSSLYVSDKYVFNVLFQYLDYNDALVRDAAMVGALRSKHLGSKMKEITESISRFGISVRQLYLSRFGALFGASPESLADNQGKLYDLNEVIKKDTVYRAAFIRLRFEEMKLAEGRRASGGEIKLPEPNRDRVVERAGLLESELEHLVACGVPLRLDWQ